MPLRANFQYLSLMLRTRTVLITLFIFKMTHEGGGIQMKFQPHEYQKFIVDFMINHPKSGLLLDMGLSEKRHLPYLP